MDEQNTEIETLTGKRDRHYAWRMRLFYRNVATEMIAFGAASGLIVDGLHRDNNLEKAAGVLVASGVLLRHMLTVAVLGSHCLNEGRAEQQLVQLGVPDSEQEIEL